MGPDVGQGTSLCCKQTKLLFVSVCFHTNAPARVNGKTTIKLSKICHHEVLDD